MVYEERGVHVCQSVGMAICSKVLMACVVATEVTQAWYLAMKNSYSNMWM